MRCLMSSMMRKAGLGRGVRLRLSRGHRMMRRNTYVSHVNGICVSRMWLANEKLQPRMMYASSKDALKRALNGLAADIQANDPDDIEHDSVIQRVSKGR